MNIEKTKIKLPEELRKRIEYVQKQVEHIMSDADNFQKTKLLGKVSFTYRHSAPSDILTKLERAQSVCFVSRYEHLPVLKTVDVFDKNNKYFLRNVSFVRHILNEYRSIIINERDSIYYNKIHNFCYLRLKNKDPKRGSCITAKNEEDIDITDTFAKILGEKNKSIKVVIEKSEFGYIYNGILQHSDHKYTDRFWQEYYKGNAYIGITLF